MHTFAGHNGTIFIFNSDFSGEMFIKDKNMNEVAIDCDDLLQFLYEKVCVDSPDDIESLDSKNDESLGHIQSPDWEICWGCDNRNTSKCNPNLCDPMEI